MNSRFTAFGSAGGLPPLPAGDRDLVDLRQLLGIARRQLRTAALCTLAGLALGIGYLAVATPLYTSTITLFINPLAIPDAPLGGSVVPVVAVSMFDSEIGILRSEKIATDTFDAIDPAWVSTAPSPLAGLRGLLPGGGAASAEARRQKRIDRLRADLGVERLDTAFLVELSYTSPSPEHAAAVLNAFLQAYLADRAAKRNAAAADELADVETRLAELQLRLADAAAAADALRPEDARALADAAGLRSQAEAYRTAIGQLLLRQQEVRQRAELPDEAVRMISPARVPVFDSSPNASRTLLLATLAGAMAGIGAGLLREALDRGFRSAGQVRRELGVPCLGLLPDLGPGGTLPASWDETLRAVKLGVDQASGPVGARRIGFAPAGTGDGATTTARSFAALIAAGGTPTLFVDADLRAEAASARPGFADLICGRNATPAEAEPNLHILSAGTERRPALARLALAAPEVGEALARAAGSSRCVVVDLPALDRTVDARAMARHLDALVVVARWRRTERRQLRALLAADRDLRRRVVGIILNRASPAALRDPDEDLAMDDLP